MHPVQVLMDEHQIILRVLGALEERTAALGQEPFPQEFYLEALDFFRNFADQCHHFKEEDSLFPAMVARGVPKEGGPIGVMLNDHEFGRACLKGVRESLDAATGGDPQAIERVRDNAMRFVEMLRNHIYKEDNILFRIAVNVLDDDEVERLTGIFSDESNPKINAATRQKYAALAAKLTGAALAA